MSSDWAGVPSTIPYANLGNPQSLNLYAYIGNNPVTGIDPDGHRYNSSSGSVGMPGCDVNTGMRCSLAEQNEIADGKYDQGVQDALSAQQQSSNSGQYRHSSWSHVRNLLHGHFWNYGMREVTAITIIPLAWAPLAPMANPAVQAATQATRGTPPTTAPRVLRTVPGPDPVIAPQLKPGEIPEIEPGAGYTQKIG